LAVPVRLEELGLDRALRGLALGRGQGSEERIEPGVDLFEVAHVVNGL
jgi:hypothetical protein